MDEERDYGNVSGLSSGLTPGRSLNKLGSVTSPVPNINKPSEMERALDRLKMSVQSLNEVLGGLSNKLHPILRPDLPRNNSEDLAKSPGYSTIIAQRINEETVTIYALADAIIQLRERLEL